jgi:hypothetical protein
MRTIFLSAAIFTLLASQSSAAIINDFVGVYAPANWNTLVEGNGSLIPTATTLSMVSPDDDLGLEQDVEFTIAAQGNGLFSFDWNYTTTDADGPEYDPAFYFNGVEIQLTGDLGGINQSGSVSVAVNQGDIIGWRLRATDSSLGAAVLVISNFSAPDDGAAVPEPTSLALWGIGLGLAAWRTRRKSARG